MYVDKVDENKKPWPGIKILLIKEGATVKSGFTPILFEDLPQGDYVVKELIPEGYETNNPTEYKFTIKDEHLFHNHTFAPFYLPDPEFYRNHQIIKGISSNNVYPGNKRATIPSWNVPGRPNNPKIGTIGYNFQTNKLEVWNGNIWFKLPMKKIS
jgi:hypothetical protein